MEFRPYYLAKEWEKMGHNVTIIGSSYSHLRKVQPKIERDMQLTEENGISYFWLKARSYSSSTRRILNILTFVLKLYYYRRLIVRDFRPDIVIASSTYPLDIYPAYSIARRSNAKLCFEVHDLWPLSPMVIGGYSKFHPFILIMQMAENFAYRYSDKVVSLLGNAKEHMIHHGLTPEKFVHIPNGFDQDEFENMQEDVPQEHQKLLTDLKNKNNMLVGYTGGHAPSNTLHTLLEAARLCTVNDDIKFILVGDGPSRTELQKESKDLNNVYFLSPVPKKSIPRLLSLFDILYIGGVKSSLHKYGISPNKLIDYMLAAKPIILSADVENEIVERIDCGFTVPAENHREVYKSIHKIRMMTNDERLKMGTRGKNYTLVELNYKNLARRFIESFQ